MTKKNQHGRIKTVSKNDKLVDEWNPIISLWEKNASNSVNDLQLSYVSIVFSISNKLLCSSSLSFEQTLINPQMSWQRWWKFYLNLDDCGKSRMCRLAKRRNINRRYENEKLNMNCSWNDSNLGLILFYEPL